MFDKITLLYITLYTVLLITKSTLCHDLCADGSAPVDRSSEDFKICKHYSSNSCCTADANYNIYDEYKRYLKARAIDSGCSSYIEKILCQVGAIFPTYDRCNLSVLKACLGSNVLEGVVGSAVNKCSPKSAHLFAGRFGELRERPILCFDYCREFLDACSEYAMDPFFAGLCDADSVSQQEYCYPRTDSQDASHHLGHGNAEGKPRGRPEDDECVPICLQKIIGNVGNIVDAAFPQDDSDRLFLVQQDGIVWELTKSREKLQKPFIDIVTKVHQNPNTDERGLLSITFHPNFNSNGLLYLFYNPNDPSSKTIVRVSEMKVIDSGSPMKVDTTSERILLEFKKPYSNHNGGQLFFGIDGYLYITVGDGGGAGDRLGNAQNLKTYLGKILRIDVNPDDEGNLYSIPNDNPFVGDDDVYPEIYAYGLRNPWRTSVDRETGEIYCGDVGQGLREEIDIILKGKNYGWNAYEGDRCFDKRKCEKLPKEDTEMPIFTYDHSVGNSVIGGFVYRGSKMTHIEGKYIFGDYKEGKLFLLERSGSKWHKKNLCVGLPNENCPAGSESIQPPIGRLFGFGEDQDGEIYMFAADTSKIQSHDGVVYKFTKPNYVT